MNPNTPDARGPIDWSAIRLGMERAEAALQDALDPSPERARAIMDTRARGLAHAPTPARPPGARTDVIAFGLGKERYAIEARYVREVVRFFDYTPVPGTPDFIVGVTNLRGVVLAVIDLRQFFNIPKKGVTDLSRVIVLGIERAEFGVLADETFGLMELAVGDIMAVQGDVQGIGRAYLKGVTSDALIILNGTALLTDGRLYPKT